MLTPENNFNIEKAQTLKDHVKIDPESFAKEKSTELQNIIRDSINVEDTLNDIELPDEEINQATEEIAALKQEIQEAVTDWHTTSESVIENDDFAAAKESWRQAAEKQFGISDFDLNIFKRTLFDESAIQKARAEGKDWDAIFAHSTEFINGESWDMATEAFEAMDKLETKAPGSVKRLHENYGITNFQRYPEELLLNQLKEIDQNKDTGLLIFATSDWSGSFDTQSTLWEKLYQKHRDHLNFRIVECPTSMSLARTIAQTKTDFEKKVSLVVISAHSEAEGFYLGNESSPDSKINKETVAQLAPQMQELFSVNAQVIANACSSGALNGWVKDLSKGAKIKALGPNQPASIEDFDFMNEEVIPIYEDKGIYSGYQNGFLLSKN